MRNLNDDDEIPSWASTASTPSHRPYVPMTLVEKIALGKEISAELSKEEAVKMIEEREMTHRLNDSLLP